jgi:hypothetical protein
MHEKTFDRLVGVGQAYVDSDRVQSEIGEIMALAANVEHLADRRYAHYDPRGLNRPRPTFNELGGCLDLFEKSILRYKLLLKGAGQKTLLPVFQYEWKEIFRQPWVLEPKEGRTNEEI